MRVALSSRSFEPIKAPGTEVGGAPALNPAGPTCVLGWHENDFAVNLQPSPAHMFGPRGVCLHPDGSLWVSDTGHHRLLGWKKTPTVDNQVADLLIGQPDFAREGRNAKGTPNAATVNVPTGICAWGEGLAVSDAWNHRVLLWKRVPTKLNQPADIVLGQIQDDEVLANRGEDKPTAASLHWPYGIGVINNKLVVCDTGNRRVLIWDMPNETGQPADLVLGQNDFTTRDENGGGNVAASSMRWPHDVALWQGWFAVSDAGNNRVMLWKGLPDKSGVDCDVVLGQAKMADCDHNMASYYPSARSLNMPYALAGTSAGLIVADTANSRLVSWSAAETGIGADRLTAQPDFASKGDNRWGDAVRDSVCWPYGLSTRDGLVAIADSGNNRILLWEVAS